MSNDEVDETAPLLAAQERAGLPESGADKLDENEVSHVAFWLVLSILLAGIFLSNVVSSVVIATTQNIASEFDALSSAAWLLTTYTLAQSASQPLYGKLCDIYGRRNCLIFCWIVFGLGCLLVALGRSYWHVILGRAISGVGSAGKIVLTSIIVASKDHIPVLQRTSPNPTIDLVPLRQVAHYRAYVNLTATSARSIGGPIGGLLAGTVGWRWCFLVQLPVALIGLSLVLWKLPEPVRAEGKLTTIDGNESQRTKLSRVDFAGTFTLIGTVLTGLLALDIFTKELIGKRDVLTSYTIIGFQSAGQFGLLYAIPIYFQVVGGESVSTSGLRIAPVVVGNALGTVLCGKLITFFKRYKTLTALGNAIGFLGFLLLFATWRGSTSWYTSLLVALPGAGMGILQSTTFLHLAASLDPSDIAIAGSAWFLAQNVGILLGASMSTTVINSVVQNYLQVSLEGLDAKEEIIRKVRTNVDNIRHFSEPIRKVVKAAYIHGLCSSNGLLFVL
uniref:Major facilitator superfamily (MFS) profile domain-containing protein n=1 Tax=Bionectria ochroleuca TaxID=29856 RepID=A0A8H7NPR9_BIOOC